MLHRVRTALSVAAALVALPLLAACDVDVRKAHDGKTAEVDIRSLAGHLSVRTNVESPDTGLPVHPGARPLQDHRDHAENAHVTVDTALFGVKVAAARFEDDDAPDAILDYYRREMRVYGDVVECRGNVDFRGPSGARTPVCKNRPWARDIQLVVGTEGRHRLVSVKPRGSGSEFAVVYLQMRS